MSSTQDAPVVVDDSQATTINTINFVLNGISIAASIVVLATYLALRRLHPQLVNRTSLRLSVAISTSDLLFSVFQIVSNAVGDGPSCAFSVWGYIYFANLSGFLYACIALNLQLVFVMQRHHTLQEYWYYALSAALAFIAATAGAVGGQYGWNDTQATCWYVGEGSLGSLLWQWGTLYLWASLTTLYCGVIILMVVWRLLRESRVPEPKWPERKQRRSRSSDMPTSIAARLSTSVQSQHTTMQQQPPRVPTRQQYRHRQQVLHLVRRLILYPVIPVLTQTWNIIVAVLLYVNQDAPYWLVFVSFQATAVQGLFNGIAFFLDPAILHALRVKRHHAREQQLQGRATLCTKLQALACCIYRPGTDEDDDLWWKTEPLDEHPAAMHAISDMTSLNSIYELTIQVPWVTQTVEPVAQSSSRGMFAADTFLPHESTSRPRPDSTLVSFNSSSEGEELFQLL